MQTRNETRTSPTARWVRWIGVAAFALSTCAAAAFAATATSAPARTTYRIVPLSASPSGGADINAKGQVAFTELIGDVVRARFYDGRAVRDIGTLGGPSSVAVALNDRGQIAGLSSISPDSQLNHAFFWSEASGMIDLNGPGQEQIESFATDINNKGQVVGGVGFTPFRWSARTGMQALATLGSGGIANAINEAGTAVGFVGDPAGDPEGFPARWTTPDNLLVLVELGSRVSGARDINAAGHIVGNVPFPPEPFGAEHAFLWTPQRGLIDLFPGSRNFTSASRINDKGMVIGAFSNQPAFSQGFIFTRETGVILIGTPDAGSSASDLNNRGQVVGSIGERAYVWTRAEGVVDLNTRIPDAPPDLVLANAIAISENGSIVAVGNTGLVLLVPQGASRQAPAVGPIKTTGTARVNLPLSFSASFKDVDLRDTHTATWSWGDGGKEAGTVSEKNGTGVVSGQHTYRAAGIYTVTLTVTDSSGKSTTVQRKVIVCAAGQAITGEGSFLSLPGTVKAAPHQHGAANFSLLSEAGNQTGQAKTGSLLLFDAPGLNFRSSQFESLMVRGSQFQYKGSGTVNGVAGYKFALTATASANGGQDRVRIQIWHLAPGSQAEIVDYDNVPDSRAPGSGDAGSPVGKGAITIHSN